MKTTSLFLLLAAYACCLGQVTTTPLGSSNSLYHISVGEVNRIDVSNDCNTIVFIYRTDNSVNPSDNANAFRYDISTDGGATSWYINQGELNATFYGATGHHNIPTGGIYNPVGNTDPDNAYFAYFDSWTKTAQSFANGSYGLSTGVAKLDNNHANITQDSMFIGNTAQSFVPVGFSSGLPGTFWVIGWQGDSSILTGAFLNFTDILVFKGTWNNSAHDVDWILDTTLTPSFDRSFNNASQATGLNMAFDPTGQFGYIAFTGDVVAGGDHVLSPVFYSTSDGGDTWSAQTVVDLQSIDTIVNNLTANPIATAAFSIDMAVDINGNVHVAVVVGSSGSDYAISTGASSGLKIYDITNMPSLGGQDWNAVLLDAIATFRGDITPEVFSDNRPQASRSPDGTKIFFSWLDSDPAVSGGTNQLPDFKTRGFDVNALMLTPVVNWTNTDPVWSGAALFGSMAPVCLSSGGNYSLPTVFVQLNASGSAEDPINFYYVKNITYSNDSFNVPVAVPDGITVVPTNALSLSLYPNPTDGNFYLSAKALSETDWNFSIYNIAGELVQEESFAKTKQIHYEVNAAYLPKGIYIVKVETAKQVSVAKVIVH